MTAPRGEGIRRIQQEIAGEKAAALGRAGERLEEAMRQAEALAHRLQAAHAEGDRDRLAGEYRQARARALQARLALVIQREALGLRRHVTVDQQYPEPPRVEDLLRLVHRHGKHLERDTSRGA